MMMMMMVPFILSLILLSALTTARHASGSVPTIIETDIGQFMDDAWGLTFLLKDPQIDIRLIVVSTNNTELRAQIVAKLCAAAGRGDIPIAVGEKTSEYAGPQSYWASDYNLSAYPGPIIRSDERGAAAAAVAAALEKALLAGERVHLVELSPPIVFAEVAQTYPELLSAAVVAQTDFMGGCFEYGYGHFPGQTAEYNAKFSVNATDRLLRAEFGAPMQLSPLDTSAQVRVAGDDYQRVLEAAQQDALLGALIESFRVWWKMCPEDPLGIMCPQNDPDSYTSSLFDLQAAAFASSYAELLRKYVVVERERPVVVNETGFTNIESGGSLVDIFMSWNDLSGFISDLITFIIKN